MAENYSSRRINEILKRLEPVYDFFVQSEWAARIGDPSISDFVVGNPHDMPLPNFTAAMQKWSVPRNKDWYAYKNNVPEAQAVVAQSLNEQSSVRFEADDIFLTNGAFAAISTALMTIVNPGDEVIFISPPWFFYETLIMGAGAQPVRVPCDPETFDLDVERIAEAITEKTRAIIVNSPNNPTGKIYPPETLKELAAVLTEASEKYDHIIYLLSDEAYRRIVYDGRDFPSPTTYYPNTFLIYTYGKTLLTPGQRLGYIALPSTMSGREALRSALFVAQLMTGFAFPNALLQHALPDLEPLSIDVSDLQRKRDRMFAALQEMGYEVHEPEGTFYLLVRAPLADDQTFLGLLAKHNIFCLPGTIVEMPGYFRISLTATHEMIDRALPGFKAAREEALAVAVG